MTGSYQYPECRSRVVKIVDPANLSCTSSGNGKGYASFCVFFYSAHDNQHIDEFLHFSFIQRLLVPSTDYCSLLSHPFAAFVGPDTPLPPCNGQVFVLVVYVLARVYHREEGV